MLEPAISLCLTSIVEMKLAPSHIIKLPWALTALKIISIAKHGLLPTTKHAVEMGERQQASEVRVCSPLM